MWSVMQDYSYAPPSILKETCGDRLNFVKGGHRILKENLKFKFYF